MKLRNVLGVAIAAALLSSTTMTFAADVPADVKLAAEQVFRYRVLDNIRTFDPQLAEDRETSFVITQMFEGLYTSGPDGEPVPGIAESHTVNEDKTVYTFKLRDAKWSNGDPVTAQDFVFAWQRAADPKLASTYAYYIDLVGILNAADIIAGTKPPTDLGVKAIDDKTLEVTLKQSTPWFIRTLAHATMYPVSQKVVEAHPSDWTDVANLVVNGAYIATENSPGERVVLKRNPNYWNNDKTVIEEVQFLTINDENQGLTRWRAGEVDQTDTPIGQYPALEAEMPDQVHSVPDFCTYYISVNMTDSAPEALRKKEVRQALNLAIDRDIIVNAVLQAGQTPAYIFTNPHTAGFVAPTVPIEGMTQEERDAKAKELMTAAGHGPDNPLTLDYIYNTSEAHKAIIVAVSQMWKEKLGVNINMSDMEFAVLSDRRHTQDYQLARNAWCGDYNEPSTFVSLYDSKSDQNDSGWSHPEVDKLLAEAKLLDDPAPLYGQIEQIAAEEVPIMPIYFYAKAFLQKPTVKGWPFENVEQTWYAKDMYITAE
jgi:oligopeptide transport system substrate-binding protein